MARGAADTPLVSRLRVGQWFALATAVFGVVAIIGAIVGVLALERLGDAREQLVGRYDPSLVAALNLSTALVDQESGVRGYALGGRAQFLEPYRSGRRGQAEAAAALRSLAGSRGMADLEPDLTAVERAAETWRRQYAAPTIVAVRAFGRSPGTAADNRGKARFDDVRSAVRRLQAGLVAARAEARSDLYDTARLLNIVFGVMLGVLALAGIAGLVALRRIVSRPLARLGGETRRVSRGDFAHAVESSGPRDIVALGSDVEAMRQQIVAELDAVRDANARLDRQALDLQRSNAELEQFAYVASHDLQEPLRKVASFTQLLQRRYQGQLDERADQYIEFAVDGAVRMQRLINDLLAFSRVGRVSAGQEMLDARELVDAALANLAGAIEETEARIEVGEMPAVCGEAGLLTAVFQNLIGNALKFRGPDAPLVRIAATREDGDWHFTVVDNGIGIEPEYADRIFVIFQRLHTKEAYSGTGIGLALCRKIVEYHGGRIWLDTDAGAGTTFHFTLPVPEES